MQFATGHRLFLVFLALMFMHCVSKVKDGDTYECMLLESYRGYHTCGIFIEAAAMKFNLLDQNTEIAVVIRCPADYDSAYFLRDQKYKLKLTSDSSICKNYHVYNNYPNLPLYYALKVDKIQ